MTRTRTALGGLLVAALTAGTLAGSLPGMVDTAAAAEDPTADYTIRVDPAKQGAAIDDAMYGVFFEDIYWAADGGLYAELVRNRSFEFLPVDNPSYNGLTAWSQTATGGGSGAVNTVNDAARMNERNRTYLKVDLANPAGGTFGVRNAGYNAGFAVKQGATYNFSVFARTTAATGTPLTVALQNTAGAPVSNTLSLSATGDGWVKYSGVLTATQTTDAARLVVLAGGTGTLRLDMVSLLPQDTFKGRPNGLRKDLAEKIEALNPGFIRFPGGCIVNVDSHQSYDAASNYERARSYQWKDSVGPVETRATNRNFWGYNQSYGLGYYEYFQFAEDIGAMPVPDVPALINGCGQGLRDGEWNNETLVQRHIQDTLDLIEFANGPVTSTWGKLRADMGHPASFNLTRMEIGNEENYPEAFIGNFVKFRDAIKAKYPDMLLISNSGPDDQGAAFEKHWQQNRAENVEMVDEHYYNSPQWFLQNNNRYDSYDRNGPKVWIGEYASQDNKLYNGLTEAAYMTGLERNADVVKMASYAPLLANIDNVQWFPDLIWFDNDETWGSANYEVQKLFMNNVGDRVVPTGVTGKLAQGTPITGGIGLSTWSTTAKYDDVKVTGTDGATLYADDFNDNNADGWTNLAGRGNWSAADGTFTQSDVNANDTLIRGGTITAANYDLSVKATKTAGAEGFLVGFGVKDSGNYYWWNLGSFGNTRNLVEKAVNGGKQGVFEGTHTPIVTNRAYDVDIQVRGNQVTLFLDGVRQGSFTDQPAEPFAQVLTKDDTTGDLILKVVNAQNTPAVTNVDLGGTAVAPTAAMTVLTGDPAAVNSRTAQPIAPVTSTISGVSSSFTRTFPANSVTFIRMAPATAPTDTTAPVVTAALNPATPDGADGWYRGTTTLTVSATDSGSGLASTEYRVGSGAWTAYTAPIVVPEGTTGISYRATDVAGNTSTVGTTTVKRDATAPTVTGTLSGRAVTATAADAGSGIARIEYQLDGGTWTAYTAPVTVDARAHTVLLRSTDTAGLVSATATVTVPAGATGETATVTLTSNATPTADGWYNQTVLVTLAVPAGTKAQYRINGNTTWNTYSRAFTVSTTGSNTVETRLLRSGVVVDGSLTSTSVKVDTRVPAATATRNPGSGSGSPRNPITVTFAGTDTGSGVARVEYQDNGSAWKPVTGPLVVDTVATHLISYRSIDVAGNVSAVRTLTVVVNADTPTSVKLTSSTVAAGGFTTLVMAGFHRYDTLTSKLTLNGTTVALGAVGSDVYGTARATVQIPATTANGTWTVTTTDTSGTTASTTLKVTGGSTTPPPATPADTAYAMAYFTESLTGLGNDDNVHFAVSDDALNWTPVNDNKGIVDPQLGTGGIRDPFLYRLQNGTWVLLATDICKTCNFTTPNQAVHVWTSPDLATWSQERMLKVNDNASYSWAPSVYWDATKKQYGILYSTEEQYNGVGRAIQKVVYTTNFVTASAPQVFYDSISSIDTHLIPGVDGWNYLYIKEIESGKMAGTRSRTLDPGSFVKYTDGVSVTCTEAPTLVKSLTANTWYLWGDNFCPNSRFYVWQGDIAQGNWTLAGDRTYTGPPLGKHNTIATITAAEKNNLTSKWGTTSISRIKSWVAPDRFIRHAGGQGRIDAIPFDPYQDGEWRVRPGLADGAGVSFESVNFPGQYLRHSGFAMILSPLEDTAGFRGDATFYQVPGLADAGWSSFRSFNFPDRYLRQVDSRLRIDPITDAGGRDDATFRIVS